MPDGHRRSASCIGKLRGVVSLGLSLERQLERQSAVLHSRHLERLANATHHLPAPAAAACGPAARRARHAREGPGHLADLELARRCAQEVREIACGLASLGFRPLDNLAIVGANRPHLYMAMVAAQSPARRAGAAVPGRGGRRDGLHAGRREHRVRRSPKTRSRSTSCWNAASSARSSRTSSTTTRAACATTTQPGLRELRRAARAGPRLRRAAPRPLRQRGGERAARRRGA